MMEQSGDRTGDGDLCVAKARLRRTALLRRAQAASGAGDCAGRAIARHGLAWLAPSPPGAVSGYWPVRSEIDARPLLTALFEAGWQVLLPFIAEPGADMVFRTWQPGLVMPEGFYGIAEPPPECEAFEPDVLLVPLLAFDGAGYRLGYGGGYYDRKLAALRQAGRITAIGLAFDEQEVAKIPREPHDQRLDGILTPSGRRLTTP